MTHPNPRRAFTLVELLVVIGIIALLIGILLPTLSKARQASQATKCLANLRNFALAHVMYVADHDGHMIQAGLAHGGAHADEDVAWINTLGQYYGSKLLHRCPSDESPHWEGGTPVPPTTPADPQWRRTSYGINNFLDRDVVPWGGPYIKITQVRNTAAVVQFIEMTHTGPFAGADHPHVEQWASSLPMHQYPNTNGAKKASEHLQIDVHGGDRQQWNARANYAFLDGHAETLRFEDVYKGGADNRFDPLVAR